MFEQAVRRVYSAILSQGDIVFDIGAHLGKHTLPMAELVGPTGRVLAFEPIIEKFSQLSTELEKRRESVMSTCFTVSPIARTNLWHSATFRQILENHLYTH